MPGLILDCEVNQLNEPEPIEVAIAAIDFVDGTLEMISDVVSRQFQPKKPITCGSVAVHGILPEELQECRDSSQAQVWAREFAHQYKCTYGVGFSVDFDMDVLGFDGPRRVCVLALGREVWPQADSHKQSALMYQAFGISRETRDRVAGAHGAPVDVQMTFDSISETGNRCTTPVKKPACRK